MGTMEADTDWEAVWAKLEPGDGFDKGVSAPVLASLPYFPGLPSSDKLTALVPGCGRGYDVYLLASHERFAHVTGLELAPSAVAAARHFLTEQALPDERYTVAHGDFFDASVASGPFDVAFDYTFFCAIPPCRRAEWAAAYAARMRPGAVLATLMFPVGKPAEAGGPPFGVSVEDYNDVLAPEGFECVEGPHIVPDDMASEERGEGQSVWAVWRLMG